MQRERSYVRVPVRDRERAIAFYSALLGIDLELVSSVSVPLRFEERSAASTPIYLRIDCLDRALEVVWSQGGCVLEPERLESGPVRSILVLDSEGNRVTLEAREPALEDELHADGRQ
jgi:predicted enzyme related to lactoylglutathione lyase